MVGADAAGGDVGFEIVLAKDGRASETPEHGDLADMIQRVGDRTLEEAFGGTVERLGRGQVIVEFLQSGEEALDFSVPGKRRGVVPGLLALRDGERPIEKVAQMGEDLRGRARLVADMESGEAGRSTAQSFSAAVGNRS